MKVAATHLETNSKNRAVYEQLVYVCFVRERRSYCERGYINSFRHKGSISKKNSIHIDDTLSQFSTSSCFLILESETLGFEMVLGTQPFLSGILADADII